MAVTPQDIQDKEFREAFRGYNEDDVDTFLDQVAEEYARLYQENQRMKVQLAALQQEVARLSESRDTSASKRALGTPSKDDDQRTEASRKAAEAALDEAKRRADELVTRAEARAREIDELTARRAKDVDADASAALTDAQQRVTELRRLEGELRSRIHTFLTQQLANLEENQPETTGSQPPAVGGAQDPSRSPIVERMARELADDRAPAAHASRAGEGFWQGE